MVDLSKPAEIKRQKAARQQWQGKAWTFYDALPEVRYPANFVGSALSRFILRIGIIDPESPNQPPVPYEETDYDRKPKWVSIAEDLLEGLQGAQGGQSEILQRYGTCMNISADGWLLGQDDEDDETSWEFLSTDELQFHEVRGELRAFRDREGTGIDPTSATPLPTDSIYYRRFWRPHPRFSARADGALEALQSDCERLLALNDSIQSRILNRLSQAGILFIPSGIQLPILPTGAVDAPDSDPQMQFIHRLLAYFEASIANRGGSGGAVPIPLVGPDNLGEKIRHITLDRTIDDTELKLRAETRETIRQGQDLPPEAQAGLNTASHWTTWGVLDSTLRNHLQPLADKGADGFTRVYLRPACVTAFEEEGLDPKLADRLVIIADASNVVSRPNEAEDGRALHDRAVLSDTALRRRSGVPDTDAPSEEEYVRNIGRKSGDPYLATYGMDIAKEIDWEKVGLAGGQEGAPGNGGTPESRQPADPADPSVGAPGEGDAGGTRNGQIEE